MKCGFPKSISNKSSALCFKMSDLEEIQTSVLLTTFTSQKKRYKVFFHQNKIIWDREKPPFAQKNVPIEDVIAVKYVQRQPPHPSEPPILDPNSFIIHYAKRDNQNNWRYKNIVFRHSDSIQVSSWVKTLENHLQSFKHRPKNLLVFVNPYGGKRKAMRIYEKYAKPLFHLAEIDVTVNVTQRKDQISDFVTYHNLDLYDGIICVGGDGTLSELFNGLVTRECHQHDLDLNDINVELPKPTIPIGIIPGGSTDAIAYTLYGTSDITTSVLQIIYGDKLGLDLVSVYDENKLIRLFASTLSYGYLGDVAHHSDKYRFLGPRRYEYSGFRKILGNQGYTGEIALAAEKNKPTDPPSAKCAENCKHCDERNLKIGELEWKTITGKFFMVNVANISCACTRSPNGMAPYSHIGDGHVHIVLVKHTSLINNIKLLLTLTKRNKNINDLPFVTVYQAKEVCFRAVDKKGKWNCDGEVQHQSDIRAKVRCQLITVYGRRPAIVPVSDENTCCLFC